MKLRQKYPDVVLNLLVAVAVSLVVNFSYLLQLLVDRKGEPQRPAPECVVGRADEGVLSVSPDGHGYLFYENSDSVYVPMSRIRRLQLADGDRLVVDIAPPRTEKPGAHPTMVEVKRRNGEKFDYSTVFNRPPQAIQLSLQLIYYVLLSFVLLSILTSRRHSLSTRAFVWRSAACLAVGVGAYCVAPVVEWHTGQIMINFRSGHMLDYMLLLKCSFAVIVSMLYGLLYVLLSQRQAVVVENERLKNENLSTRYNMLVGQINPHFFFNSLNSLAMLVREGDSEKALTYIDQLSYTFRYIIQNGQSTLVTLDEELKFGEAYGYLFKIRYADKLFFDVDIEEEYRTWLLPALSLQPLIGNAVKHNTITRSRPFHITIRTRQGRLEVSNRKIPKLEAEPSTGIGLENLRNRWQLITGRDIEIVDTDEEFTVGMPLKNPAE